LASDNPTNGSLISSNVTGGGSAARVPVLAVNFTAGNSGAVTLSGVNFQKTGVLADSSVSGAYLTENGQVVAQYNSINQGVITFSGMSLQIPAGQTVELTLAIDVSSGLSAGNTTGFSLQSASAVTAWDPSNNAITPNGSFPLMGTTFTVTTVSNPSLATLVITSSSIGTAVTAGTQGDIVGAWNFNVGNNKVWLDSLNFHVIGSANKGDIRNVKLMVNGVQVGATLAAVPANGMAYFNAMSAPGALNTGSNNVQLVADVMGSPSFNFQFEILNGYDVLAVDSQYNVPISLTNTGGTGSLVTINQGTVTVSQDSSTPTGNIAAGQSGVALAKFDMYAGGEPVKVQFIGFSLAFTGVNTASDTTLSQMVKNIALSDDAGGQVGTTINTPPSSNVGSCDAGGSSVTGFTTAGLSGESSNMNSGTVTYVDCFGTSGSNINYIVPANTTRVLTLKADIQSGASFGTVLASLLGESNNLQGQISSQTGSSSGASGSSLTLQSTLLTVAQNNSIGTQTLTPNSTGATIGSYAFTASSASGVQINTISIKAAPGASASFMQNLRLMVNGTQFGTTQATVGAGANAIYAFSGSPFTVPAGQTVNVNVVADTLSSWYATSTANLSPVGATQLTGCSGTGVISYNAVTCGSVTGQNVTFNSNGTTLAITADANTQAATQYVMPSSQVALATFDFAETQNIEPVKITALTVTDNAGSGVLPGYGNLQLYNGSTPLGTASAAAPKTTTTVTPASYPTGTITVGTAASSSQGVAYVTIGGVQVAGSVPATTSTLNTAVVAAAINTIINNNSATLNATSSISGSVVTFRYTKSLASTTFSIFDTVGTVYSTGTGVTSAGVAGSSNTNSTGLYGYTFNFATPIIVPQNNSVALTLRGDLPSFTAGAVTDNSTSSFSIAATTDVTALGANSSKAPTITSTNPSGNLLTVLRTTLTPSLAVTGTTRAARSTSDQVATLTFTPNVSGPATLGTTTLTFSGSLVSSTASSTFLAGVQLWLNGTPLTSSTSLAVTSSSGANSAGSTKTWNFSGANGISAGSPLVLQVVINDNLGTSAATNGISYGLQVGIQNTGDVVYTDSSPSDSTGKSVTLPANLVPQSVQVGFNQGI